MELTNMGDEFKKSIQEKFQKNYDQFLKVQINDVTFDIMPVQRDVPVIEEVGYDDTTDELIIKFETFESQIKILDINLYVSYYVDENEYIVGLVIKNLSDLIKHSSEQSLNNKLQIRSLLRKGLDWNGAIRASLEKRNLESVKDFIQSDGHQLQIS